MSTEQKNEVGRGDEQSHTPLSYPQIETECGSQLEPEKSAPSEISPPEKPVALVPGVSALPSPAPYASPPSHVTALPPAVDRREKLRILEALLFAAAEPLNEATLSSHLEEEGVDIQSLLEELQEDYARRGIHLRRISGKWAFRTAEDLSYLLEKHAIQQKRLSKAAIETLAIIAYHQPVTRSEIEEIRGVSSSKGTLDVLLETGWIRLRGRRRTPGQPITYGTTESFLDHFGLNTIKDLPGLRELKGAGLLEGNLPPDFSVPVPDDSPDLQVDEASLDEGQEGLL